MKTKAKLLGGVLILTAVFCLSFYLFYTRARNAVPKQPLILTPAVINRPLPKANLVNISGEALGDEKLRRGRVVLAFMMPDCIPCDQENEFLKTVAGARRDVSFIYVIPFGSKDQSLAQARSKYALEPFFDEGSSLSRKLQLYQVPVKVFLEDGVIKKTWLDATVDDRGQAEFKDWLNSL